MELSRSQIDHMRREESVEHGGVQLPSLKRKCSELGLRQDGTSVVLRKRLRRYKRENAALEALQCPICTQTPPHDELMVICSSGHHVCFSCLLHLLHRTPHAGCPLCRQPVQVQGPGYLLRQLIPTALQEFARSDAYALYTQLQACQFFRSVTTLEQCRQMAQLWCTPGNRAAAEKLVDTWRQYTTAMTDLERQCAQHYSSEETSDSEEE